MLSGGDGGVLQQWALTPTGLAPAPLRSLGAAPDAASGSAAAAAAAAVLCVGCVGGAKAEASWWLGASGQKDGTVAVWDVRARDACVWRAPVHQDACTGVGLADGGWVVSCARDGSVAASHLGGGRRRLLRAAGGGPAQRCLHAVGGAALSAGDGGAACVWDLRAMALGGTLQGGGRGGEGQAGQAVHALHAHAEDGEPRSLLLGLADGSVETWGPALRSI